LSDREAIGSIEPYPVVEHPKVDGWFGEPAGLEFDVEDAAEGFEEGEGVGTDGFDAEFGFEDFDVGLGDTEEPGGEAIGVFFGENFGEVIVGHGAISTVLIRISVLIIFCLVGVFDSLSEVLRERSWNHWHLQELLGRSIDLNRYLQLS
jgi:hypothetical protein